MARQAVRRSTARQEASGLLADLGDLLQILTRGVFDTYRPELHYMRGPGPKWHAKHDRPDCLLRGDACAGAGAREGLIASAGHSTAVTSQSVIETSVRSYGRRPGSAVLSSPPCPPAVLNRPTNGPPPCPATRCAILDDYQNVALKMTDWSKVAGDLDIKVFSDISVERTMSPRRCRASISSVAMRERTRLPARGDREAAGPASSLITTGMRNASIDGAAAQGARRAGLRHPGIGNPTSGIAIGLMLELTRRIGYENARMKAGVRWQSTIGLDLDGLTLGVLGLASSAPAPPASPRRSG